MRVLASLAGGFILILCCVGAGTPTSAQPLEHGSLPFAAVDSTGIFVVYGIVFEEDAVTPWPDADTLIVRNARTGKLERSVIGASVSGGYTVTFVDLYGSAAAVEGDSLWFTISDSAWAIDPPVIVLGASEARAGLLDRSLRVIGDLAPPEAIQNLTSSPAGGGETGRTHIALDWSGAASGTTVRIYRIPFGDYPFYQNGGVPSVPSSPQAATDEGWTLTAVTTPGGLDLPPERDYWYYVLFLADAGGRTSGPSNLTAGELSYLLGDVSDGLTLCAGDNSVGTADVSLLGAHYYSAIEGPDDPIACIDVGPTIDMSIHGRPVPDGFIDFEDLMLFALNISGAKGSEARAVLPALADRNTIGLDLPAMSMIGEESVGMIWAEGDGTVQGLSIQIGFDDSVVQLTGMEAGALLDRQEAPAMAWSRRPGQLDVVLLGRGVGLRGTGEIARVRYRRVAEGPMALRLAAVDARNGENRPVNLAISFDPRIPAPALDGMRDPRPNPWSQRTTLLFSLATPGRAALRIYSVTGREVRSLLQEESMPPGEYSVTWDGLDDAGHPLPAGTYFARLDRDQGGLTRALIRLR